MNNYLDTLQWRYATKKFDSSKKLSEKETAFLKDAMQLSASSYGLQPYEILFIKDATTRQELLGAAWNQSQITDAAYVIVIANKTDFGDELVDAYIENTVRARGGSAEDLKGYADFMKKTLGALTTEEKAQWTAKQTYIVLGNLLSAAAAQKIDACPMEGFDADAFNNILGLTDRDLNASVIVTVGYRDEADQTQHLAKVRKPSQELFTSI